MPHTASYSQSFSKLFATCWRAERAQTGDFSFVATSKTAERISSREQVSGVGALVEKIVRFVRSVAAKFTRILNLSSHKQNREQTVTEGRIKDEATNENLHKVFKDACSGLMHGSAHKVTSGLKSLTPEEFSGSYEKLLSQDYAMRSLGCIFSNLTKLGYATESDELSKLDIGYGFSFKKANDEGLIKKMMEDKRMAQRVLNAALFVGGETEAAFSEGQRGSIDIGEFCSKLLKDLKEKFSQAGSHTMTESVAETYASENCEAVPANMMNADVPVGAISENKTIEGGKIFFFDKLTVECHERKVGQSQPTDGSSSEGMEAGLLVGRMVSDDAVGAKKELPLPSPSNWLSSVNFKFAMSNPTRQQFKNHLSELQRVDGGLHKLFAMFETIASEGSPGEKSAVRKILGYSAPQQLKITMGQLFGSAKEEPILLSGAPAVAMLEQLEKKCCAAVESCKSSLAK